MILSDNTEKLLKHPKALCNMLRRVAVEAGDHTLQYFDESGSHAGYALDRKEDGSPVTIADREAEDIILNALRDITPGIPVVGEESIAAGIIPDLTGHDWFFLVDPVDGTREFIRGSPDYTVNIALIHRGEPVLGIVYAPVIGELYAGCGPGTAIRWLADTGNEKPLQTRDLPPQGLTAIISRSLQYQDRMDVFLQDFKLAKTLRRSSSLKICLIAAGKADIYPRFGQTCEWDTAAGDAVLRAAGGHIVDLNGTPLSYGHAAQKFFNPEFVASSGFWPLKE